MRVAIVGATGMVGGVLMQVLEERAFPLDELYLVASERSIGKEVEFKGKTLRVIGLQQAVSLKPDIAIFSAGGSTSIEWAPKFAEVGTTVIDNSSAWRMDPSKKLIVPEINGSTLNPEDKIIANPNCSTIQMVLALKPLHDRYGIKRIVVSTYQSVSGTGVKALEQLNSEREGRDTEQVYPHPIDMNCLPHGGDFDEDGNTTEEIKLIKETRKILDNQSIQVNATVVRVPVKGGHSESVNVEFQNAFDVSEVRSLLHNMPGVTVKDDPSENSYPMPLYAEGKDDVFVGRIRRDDSQPNTLSMWIVSDNLRKGAATNAVQIAESLLKVTA